MKFSVLFTLILNPLFARESFEFNLGQRINVLSDKAFRKTSENEFEAIGNVVITHMKNAIYGEKAKINFTTGDTEVIGNVRYIAPEMTLYGTKLKYNFITREIDMDNARALSENFVITGKKIIQTDSEYIYATEAEYTTCRDCPGSWSVFGKQVTIQVGKYVRIKYAYIKVNGVVTMYFPYIVFPIKQKRESGLLFPLIGFNSKEGFRYQQPFFLAIDDYKDATITPSTFGSRGLGGELQFRQNFAEKTWLEINTLQLNDKIYKPFKLDKEQSGTQFYRHFSNLEFHSIYGHNFNNHFYFNNTSDLDTIRDLDYFTKDKLTGSEIGGGGFLETRSSLFSLTTEGYFNRNMLVPDPKLSDNHYVQILPKITLSSVPYNLFHTNYPFLKNATLGLNSDYTIFKQNNIETDGLIRNARRLNLAPYLNWQLGNLGPVFFSHQVQLDYQNYSFPHEEDKHFTKNGLVFQTEAAIELEKIFGLAYMEEKENSQLTKKNSENKSQTTIESLPNLQNKNDKGVNYLINNSYRHSQIFKLKHYYLANQNESGNSKFKTQIETDAGQFDYVDALRARDNVSNQITPSGSLPLSNTLEFQWNNKLIKKSTRGIDPFIDGRYLKDNFDYSTSAYFDLSQGVDFNVHTDQLINRLTRLYVNTGVTLDKTSFSVQEYYFHKTSEHNLTSSAGYNFERVTISGTFQYNSFNSASTPITKLAGYNLSFRPTDLVTITNIINYNLQAKLVNDSFYSILYSPLNNCWKLAINYSRNLIDSKYGLLFYINYNENNFIPINVR